MPSLQVKTQPSSLNLSDTKLGRLSICKEFSSTLEFFFGSRLAEERLKRIEQREQHKERRLRAKKYAASRRWSMLLRRLSALLNDFERTHALLPIADVYGPLCAAWAKENPNGSPPSLLELKLLILGSEARRERYHFLADCLLVPRQERRNATQEALSQNNGLISLSEAAQDKAVVLTMLQVTTNLALTVFQCLVGCRDQVVLNFLRANKVMPAVWDASVGWIPNEPLKVHTQINLAMQFVNELTEQDLQ
jgi:hypothetical protein